ncbi:TolC family protein [Allomuricauda sp. SCSIO 65647]|uniref:TolC family protein n=1 Tax=Allomuricauda sp. SCSIO 65647 TaxID=2908843 RepID=UPI001F36AEE7|nr:TolC family protein [Muricauda sp. SCSIO 65647]UJH69137.1 TolC family protein [Muricauda sp. SCSIO 65647]
MLRYSFTIVSLLVVTTAAAQKMLTVDEAMAIAVANNHDLRIAKNNTEIADIEASTFNSGYLPSLSASGGVSYSDENQSVTFSDGNSTSIDGAVTESYNASITTEYLIFDGLVRKFTQDRNEEALTLAQLQERQKIENTIISIYENYFNVAFQKQVVENLKLNIENSKDRLVRAQKQLKYGQGTTLDELNAKVDLNNDSISYTEAVRDLKNLKRSLNLLLGRGITTSFEIDTTVVFVPVLEEQRILESAEEKNIQAVLAKQNVLLSELDIKISKAQFLPKINGSGSYRWNESQNPPTSFALANESYGINLGLNLSWNIFDGSSVTRVKTSKITKQNREIELIKVKDQLLTDVLNAYETYNIAQYALQAENKNLETNRLNFSRTQRQYGLGQITSIEFRQAQINLFNARNNHARAKYDLKLAEVTLLQLGGVLIN